MHDRTPNLVCPQCEKHFQPGSRPQKVYCSLDCREKAKNTRHRQANNRYRMESYYRLKDKHASAATVA
jgi:hypothetical protein